MEALILFFTSFIIVYLFYLFFVILSKKKMNKFMDNVYVKFLVKTYNLNEKELNVYPLAHVISLANAFIISITFTIICFIDSFILKMLLAFAVLVPIQLLVYFIIGKWLQKNIKNNTN